jgi:hypothetical protein
MGLEADMTGFNSELAGCELPGDSLARCPHQFPAFQDTQLDYTTQVPLESVAAT